MPVILGIDPGSSITGFGVIDSDGKSYKYIASGSIRLSNKEFSQKLIQIYSSISDVITKFAPDEAAIEDVFVHANVNSALKLGQARGAAIVAIGGGNIKLAEYPTRKVKQAVVGFGAAEKAQVAQMVKLILKLKELPQADEADALAVAICHANNTGFIRVKG